MENKFKVIEEGAIYHIPKQTYINNVTVEVIDEIQEIVFVKGATDLVSEIKYNWAIDHLAYYAPYFKDAEYYDKEEKVFKKVEGERAKGIILEEGKLEEYAKYVKEAREVIDKYHKQEKYDGVTHEQLVEMLIYDLESKQKVMHDKNIEQVIIKFKEALAWLKL